MPQFPPNLQFALLKWFPTGLGVFYSGHLVRTGGKVKELAIAFGATVIYPIVISLFEGFMKGAKKKADIDMTMQLHYLGV